MSAEAQIARVASSRVIEHGSKQRQGLVGDWASVAENVKSKECSDVKPISNLAVEGSISFRLY